VFQASSTSIESLIAQTKEADFAVLVLTADDVKRTRGTTVATPRDNSSLSSVCLWEHLDGTGPLF